MKRRNLSGWHSRPSEKLTSILCALRHDISSAKEFHEGRAQAGERGNYSSRSSKDVPSVLAAVPRDFLEIISDINLQDVNITGPEL
jgi:hypothetical protein